MDKKFTLTRALWNIENSKDNYITHEEMKIIEKFQARKKKEKTNKEVEEHEYNT
ncbi:hypothetical protein [Geotoga petraea]|jgi:hypothetical protein|uniref:EF-hand domain-containing protein n=1 Tax=Geotoga petraea TaxID=28234 RepID=A0A1G6LPT0_9BACT|nr:hypothetical protein [Geotoga petraea]SDC45298.1 hypothetical protein SAMN04488588_1108 [Geotoga petraea]